MKGFANHVQQGDLPVHSLGYCHADDWVNLVESQCRAFATSCLPSGLRKRLEVLLLKCKQLITHVIGGGRIEHSLGTRLR